MINPKKIFLRGRQTVIFTDLDGTLLDRDRYSYQEANEAVIFVKKMGIPIIFCSAKTRVEQEFYQQALHIADPFIVENGGAIFIRRHYFNFPFDYQKSVDDYHVIELGIPYERIRRILNEIRSESNISFKGYGDMDVSTVSSETGLDVVAAQKAMQREYTETVKLDPLEKPSVEEFKDVLHQKGLQCTFGGKFYGVMGGNDKGKAVKILIELLQRKFGDLYTIGIGDSLNDKALFSVVDLPILVQKSEGEWEDIEIPNLYKVKGSGPVGWSHIFKAWLNKG
jgi:mannosyl-3-phosphoglycerate phosphatase